MEATKETTWAILNLPTGMIEIDDEYHIMPVAEFLNDVKLRNLIDYDGCGVWATKTHCLGGRAEYVFPSEVRSKKTVPPVWATHVVWFNR